MSQPSRRTNILISQISILLISIVTAFIPQYYIYIFIIYFIILMAIMFRTTRRMSKIPPQKELGSPLFKEKDAMKIAMFDKNLVDELKKQAMGMMSLLFMTFLLLIIFPLYRATVFELTLYYFYQLLGEESIYAVFLSFLLMYEFIFGLMSLLRMLVMKRTGSVNIMLPQTYVVYHKGMVFNERFYLEFSSNYCIDVNEDRRYVEIRDRRGVQRIRLYTSSLSELRDRLRTVGLQQCMDVEKIG